MRNSRPISNTTSSTAQPAAAPVTPRAATQKKSSQPRKMVDLGAALNYSASAANSSQPVSSSNDLFSVSDSAPISENRSVDLFGNAFASQPAAQSAAAAVPQNDGGSFWGESTPSTAQPTPQQPDFFASAPVSAAPAHAQAPQVDLFASLSSSTPTTNNSSQPPPGAGL